jgi:hypothetical protein
MILLKKAPARTRMGCLDLQKVDLVSGVEIPFGDCRGYFTLTRGAPSWI